MCIYINKYIIYVCVHACICYIIYIIYIIYMCIYRYINISILFMCVCTHVYVLTAPAIFLVFAFVAAFEFLNFQNFPWFLRFFLRFLNF